MKLSGNTVFITGGGSGIGRGIAGALHQRDNKVIIAGRRRAVLDAVVATYPGMEAIELDVRDPEDIQRVASRVTTDHPGLNVLFNNAGVMMQDDASGAFDDAVALAEVETNFLGPIRLSGAFVKHLKRQPQATILYNSSFLAFTPLAMFAAYSATKAALHSYALSQRFMLRHTSVRVQEIAPPYVGGTDLVGDPDNPNGMQLDRFVEATMEALAGDGEEVMVEEARQHRNNAGPNEHSFVNEYNTFMAKFLAE